MTPVELLEELEMYRDRELGDDLMLETEDVEYLIDLVKKDIVEVI